LGFQGLEAAELKEVKVFVGDRHAQLLLVSDGSFNRPDTQSTGPIGSAPARAQVKIRGATIDSDLRDAYAQAHGRFLIPVDRRGVRQVTLSMVGSVLHVGVESDTMRTVRVRNINERALLIDLIEQGAGEDASLPSPELLASWISGASLRRQAEATSGEKRRLVVLDAGHGGRDPGAVGFSGIHESDVALALTKRVKRSLERRFDVEVVLTREDDQYLPLRERAGVANALDADLFVSIHANASPSQNTWGIETYYLDAASDAGAARVAARENALSESTEPGDVLTDLFVTGTNRLSKRLAHGVQSQVISKVREVFGEEQTQDLGVKTALFAVLVWSRMPSILFESSFLSNPEDELRLRMPLYQQTLADAMAEGIAMWFEEQDR
jgi:N-acetylmuramoyl-L-alanine amidase